MMSPYAIATAFQNRGGLRESRSLIGGCPLWRRLASARAISVVNHFPGRPPGTNARPKLTSDRESTGPDLGAVAPSMR